jgi:hypothetical protein
MLQGQEVSHIYESITTCYSKKYCHHLYIAIYNSLKLSGVFKPFPARKLNGKQVRLVCFIYTRPCLCCPRNGKQVWIDQYATVVHHHGKAINHGL